MDLRFNLKIKDLDPIENEDYFNIKKCKILNYEKNEKKLGKLSKILRQELLVFIKKGEAHLEEVSQ